MFVKLTVFACFVAVALAQYQQKWNGPLAGGLPAHQYPAGVSPSACPNFPNCANPAVAANPNAAYAGGWNHGANQWNGGNNWNNGGNDWNNGGNWNGGNNGQWNGDNQWNNGNDAWNNHANPLDRGEYVGDGDYRGEGLAESGAYGPHQSWNNNNGGNWNEGNNWNGGNSWNAAPQYAGGHQAQVPAGVDPHSCPNYPFCH